MRIVVTGGAGFIGSQITDARLDAGDEVLVIDDLSTGYLTNLESASSKHSKAFRFCEADICSDAAAAAIVEFRPEIVFHQAAQMNVRKSVSDPDFDAEKNVVGTVKMLEAARRAGTRRFLFSSTGGAIYGEQEQYPADESHRVQPECPYGVSKRAGELYLEYYARVYGLQTVALRYANVYGPRQNPKGEAGVVAIFIDRMLAGDTLRINGDGKQTRDFVFVADVVRANMLASAAELTQPFSVFNVGTGKESTLLDLVEHLQSNYALTRTEQEPTDVVVEHGPALPGEQRRSVIDAARISQQLGWSAAVSFRDGLLETLESFRRKKSA